LPGNQLFKIATSEWKVFFVDFEEKFINRVSLNSHWSRTAEDVNVNRQSDSFLNMPVMTYSQFRVSKSVNKLSRIENMTLTSQSGVYLLLPATSWSKGAVFLNNFNLGRYWSVGPLCTLFVPEFMLYEGLNELMIFELSKPNNGLTVYFTNSHVVI
jgi:hypothetical protein